MSHLGEFLTRYLCKEPLSGFTARYESPLFWRSALVLVFIRVQPEYPPKYQLGYLVRCTGRGTNLRE